MKKWIYYIFIIIPLLFTSCIIELPNKRGVGFVLEYENKSNEELKLYMFWCEDGDVFDNFESTKRLYGWACERFVKSGKSDIDSLRSKYDKIVAQACLIIRVEELDGTVLWQGAGWPESWKENPPENWKNIPDKEYDAYGLGFIDYKLNNSYNVFYVDSVGNTIHNDGDVISYNMTITEDKKIEIELDTKYKKI